MSFCYEHLWYFVAATIAGWLLVIGDYLFYECPGPEGFGHTWGLAGFVGWPSACIASLGFGLACLKMLC
jgi:hypothetical protein